MANDRKELLRLLKAFTPQGPFTKSGATKAAAAGVRGAKAAVATIQKARGVSTQEAVTPGFDVV